MSTAVPIGRGRSAIVYRLASGDGVVARKVFTGSSAANAVHVLVYGAPNDYLWCNAAIQAAFHRRRVLGALVDYWFGGRITVADTLGWGVDPEHGANYLDTVFCAGHHARLYSPFLYDEKTEVYDLRGTVLPELQKHLIESGFVGTVWQAGKGHPCALPNFLCTRHGGEGKDHHWEWIDAESGVPAIASYEPFSLLGFYLPQALKRGRLLFDDIDADRVTAYVDAHGDQLQQHLGEQRYAAFRHHIDGLLEAHARWGRETRHTRSLTYFRFREKITPEQYEYYSTRPWRWQGYLLGAFCSQVVPSLLGRCVRKLRQLVTLLSPVRWVVFFFKVTFIRAFRADTARSLAQREISEWEASRRLTPEQAEHLREELRNRDVDPYLADFGVHLAMKPLGYILRATLVPYLAFSGLIGPAASAVLFAFCGVLLRCLYVLFRSAEELLCGRRPPFVALLISPLPSVGTLAFPCQMIRSAQSGHLISQFIIYAMCSTIAEHIPIWGGRDTGWDHFFNQLAHRIIRFSASKPTAPEPADGADLGEPGSDPPQKGGSVL